MNPYIHAHTESQTHTHTPRRNLEVLDVSDNQLAQLPATLCDVSSLLELYAQKNAVRELQGPVHQWKKLKVRHPLSSSWCSTCV